MIPVFFGCETADDLGIRYDLDSSVDVKFEEFSLPATNIYLDSLRTDNEGVILVGNSSNEVTGSLYTEGYVSLRYDFGSLPTDKIEESYLYDSVRIIFLSAEFKGDNQSYQQFEFHELVTGLEDNFVYLRSNKQEKYRSIGLDSSLFRGRDSTFYNFQLSNDFGVDLFRQFDESNGLVSSEDFPSLAITSSTFPLLNVPVTGDSIGVYLYVTDPDAIIEIIDGDTITRDTTYAARFTFGGAYYSYIERDRTGSKAEGIENEYSMDFDDGTTIIDPLAGVVTAVDMSSIVGFFDQDSSILISSGTFIYDFDESTSSDTLNNFMHFFRRPDGAINGAGLVTDLFGNIIMSDVSYLDPFSNQNISVSALNSTRESLLLAGTLFLQSLYRDYQENDSLLFTNPDPSRDNLIPIKELVTIGINNITFSQSTIKKDGVKLRIYYTQVD